MADTNTKKKGCLSRAIMIAAGALVLLFVLVFALGGDDEPESISDKGRIESEKDNGEVELISEEERLREAGQPKASQNQMLNMVHGWYGYLPDEEDDDYYFMDDDYYDYDYDDYGDDYDWDDYDYDWDDYDYEWDDDDWAWLDELFDDDYDWGDIAWDDDWDDDDWGGYDYDWDDDDDGGYDWDDSWKKRDDKRKDDKKRKDDGNLPNIDVGGSEKRKLFLARANGFKGTPYRLGGVSHSAIDCSGLVYAAAKEAGIGILPHNSGQLYNMSKKINKNQARAGDLVFFASGSSISHVSIYIGNNQVLHAVSDGPKTGVIVSSLSENYWKNHYHSMGKIFDD